MKTNESTSPSAGVREHVSGPLASGEVDWDIEHGTPFLWCEDCTAPWPLTDEEFTALFPDKESIFKPRSDLVCPLCGGHLVLFYPDPDYEFGFLDDLEGCGRPDEASPCL